MAEVVENQVHDTIRPARRGAHIQALDEAPAIEADVKAARARNQAAQRGELQAGVVLPGSTVRLTQKSVACTP